MESTFAGPSVVAVNRESRGERGEWDRRGCRITSVSHDSERGEVRERVEREYEQEEARPARREEHEGENRTEE